MPQLQLQLLFVIVVPFFICIIQGPVDREINLQFSESGRTVLYMTQKLFQFPVRQDPLQIGSDQLPCFHTIHDTTPAQSAYFIP